MKHFHTLVRQIAVIAFHNPKLDLFFRGQDCEHLNSKGLTKLQPSLYRDLPGKRDADPIIARHYETLSEATSLLLDEFDRQRSFGRRKLGQFPELAWAVLQHYEVCPTPLLDVTSSLRVACSFAQSAGNSAGMLYVLGMPRAHGTISYFVDDELVSLRLLSACPPRAIRPYFQEGFLVGTIPWVKDYSRAVRVDAGRRLVAKFQLATPEFWGRGGRSIPERDLLPKKDPMLAVCQRIRKELPAVQQGDAAGGASRRS